MSWADHAECANNVGPHFGSLPVETQLGWCATCRVRSECLEDALADERLTAYAPAGVRGGLTAEARAKILKDERRSAA